MFTQVALHACVFAVKHFFFCQIQCFDKAKCSFFSHLIKAWFYTQWRPQFLTKQDHFSGEQGAQSCLGEHGLLIIIQYSFFLKVLLDRGCVYQERHGWERPGWFVPNSMAQVNINFSYQPLTRSPPTPCTVKWIFPQIVLNFHYPVIWMDTFDLDGYFSFAL